MKSDIEIARSIELTKIKQIAREYGIPVEEISNYGRYIAKVPETLIDEEKVKKSNLILVTAITPTKAGIGKTTVSIGLALGLNKIGKKAFCALREPSLGPCFGMKGGAAGGGYAQVLPMDKINLHFTGDFHAITSAHNMITALLDNYMYQNQRQWFCHERSALEPCARRKRPWLALHRDRTWRKDQWYHSRIGFRHHTGIGNHGYPLSGKR